MADPFNPKKKRQEYTWDSMPINSNGQAIDANCADIMFINYGTGTLIINDVITLPPPVAGILSMIKLTGNTGEVDRTKYRCRFSAAGTRIAVVVRRNYK